MGDWEADDRRVIPTSEKSVWPLTKSTVYLWIVPARVAGYWRGTLAGPEGEALDGRERFLLRAERVLDWGGISRIPRERIFRPPRRNSSPATT